MTDEIRFKRVRDSDLLGLVILVMATALLPLGYFEPAHTLTGWSIAGGLIVAGGMTRFTTTPDRVSVEDAE